MKKKPSKVPSPKKSQSREETVFPLPQPTELAILAAILQPSSKNPADALKAAMEWYFEAVLATREQRESEQRLFQRSRKRLLSLLAMRYLRGVPVQAWSDAVSPNEAWRLLANPRELAERVNELPKEGVPPPKPGMIVMRPLDELPGFSPKLKTDLALKKSVLKGHEYMLRTNFGLGKTGGVSITPASRTFEEMFQDGKIPTFLLQWVLRDRYERDKDKKRKWEQGQSHEKKSVK